VNFLSNGGSFWTEITYPPNQLLRGMSYFLTPALLSWTPQLSVHVYEKITETLRNITTFVHQRHKH